MRIALRPFAVAAIGLLAATAAAEPTVEEWARIMNLSGRQRMLTQKMSKEALFVTAGVRPDELRAALADTTALFETTLAGLRDGHADLGLPATENPRIVKQLDKVRDIYLGLKPLLDSVAQGGALSADEQSQLAEKNVPLLKEMNKAVKMYERKAKKALGADEAGAVVINLAGKQRMLSQKMTKEALLVHLGVAEEENRLNLRQTTSLFDRTLAGLLDGDADLELPGTKNATIRSQLDTVLGLWERLAPVLDGVVAGEPIAEDRLVALSTENVTLLKEMNAAVKLFADAAE